MYSSNQNLACSYVWLRQTGPEYYFSISLLNFNQLAQTFYIFIGYLLVQIMLVRETHKQWKTFYCLHVRFWHFMLTWGYNEDLHKAAMDEKPTMTLIMCKISEGFNLACVDTAFMFMHTVSSTIGLILNMVTPVRC